MRRVLIAFFLAPLVASFSFGALALIAYPVMLMITVVFAVPLFLILRRMQWLNWWHALLAGATCGAIFVFDGLMGGWFGLDGIATANNVFRLGLGAGIGILYWWIGIFRNAAFPYVSSRFPWSFLLVVPLAALLVTLHQSLESRVDQGRVASILLEPTSKFKEDGRLIVRLTSGATVEADYGTTWPRAMIEGKCVHVIDRWSLLRNRRIWEVAGPFGGDVDAC